MTSCHGVASLSPVLPWNNLCLHFPVLRTPCQTEGSRLPTGRTSEELCPSLVIAYSCLVPESWVGGEGEKLGLKSFLRDNLLGQEPGLRCLLAPLAPSWQSLLGLLAEGWEGMAAVFKNPPRVSRREIHLAFLKEAAIFYLEAETPVSPGPNLAHFDSQFPPM